MHRLAVVLVAVLACQQNPRSEDRICNHVVGTTRVAAVLALADLVELRRDDAMRLLGTRVIATAAVSWDYDDVADTTDWRIRYRALGDLLLIPRRPMRFDELAVHLRDVPYVRFPAAFYPKQPQLVHRFGVNVGQLVVIMRREDPEQIDTITVDATGAASIALGPSLRERATLFRARDRDPRSP